MHRRLVAREGLAKSISGDLSQLASTNLLTFQIVSTTDDARTAARAVIEECARIARQGIDAQALENARQMCKSLRALDRQHETQRAFSLASAELVDSMDLELDFNDRMDRVTPEDLQRVARETLSPRRAIFVQIRPKSAEAAGVIGTQSRTLPSGVTVVFKKDTSTEVVGVALYMHGSATNETKPGLAGLLEELLSEARTSVEPPEVTQSRLERCGAVLRCGGGGIAGIIPSLNATVYTFDELLQTLHDIAVKPRFDEEPFERVRRKVVDELKERSDDPEQQGSWRLWQVFYPKETSGAPAEVAKSLQACTSGDVKAYHAKVLASRPIVVAVSGNLSAQRVFDRVEQVFADVPRPEAAPPQAVKKPKDETIPPSRVRLETIETPRPYDTVWVGFKLPASSVLDIAPMTVWMNLLILADQSMCSVKVREFDPNFEKRIAGMNTLHFGGVLAWGFRVKSGVGEKVAAWLEEFVATIPDIEVPSDRAESARRLVLTAFLRRFQDKVNHSRTLAFMMSLTNDPGFFDRLRELYEKMPDLKRVARQYFSEAYIVLYKSTARPTGGSGK
ncbi:MAG: insulinase family protein [Candidatus Riflebacteria bacterium]|nr:insulinase family protein [Candidatus Riflebacteria bacterium]